MAGESRKKTDESTGAAEMGANYPEALDDFVKILENDATPFFQAAEAGKQTGEVPVLMLRGACDLARDTLEALKTHLMGGHGAFLACDLCRPLFEVAYRVLWASREQHGWEQLQVWLAGQDKKWAKEALAMPEFAQHAKKIMDQSNQVLSRTDSYGQSLKEAPDLKTILKQIEDRDVQSGLRPVKAGQADFEYTNIYRILCRPAHAHLGALSGLRSEAFLPVVVFACGNAIFALARAMAHVGAREPEKKIQILAGDVRQAFSRFICSLGK
jgi:hypothetical protein